MEVRMGAQALAVPVVGSAQSQGGQGGRGRFGFIHKMSSLDGSSGSTLAVLGFARPSETGAASFVRCTPNRTVGARVGNAAVVPRLHRPTMIASCRS